MRTGFATSACAATAAAAALRALITKEVVQSITIDLPAMKDIAFEVVRCEHHEDTVLCGVLKDAGDDPDVTNGIEVQTIVKRNTQKNQRILGGEGVGIVTLPGLPVDVGEAAINPGPRRLILKIFRKEMERLQLTKDRGFDITIIIPKGKEIAKQTMNAKLGIIDGISILGTDGLVRPYSAPAFRTSLFYELRVAHEKGCKSVALTTGKRSSAYLAEILQKNNNLEMIDVGDELGYPMEQAVKMGFRHIMIGGMIGKLSKVARGRFQTHVKDGEIDFDFLSSLAQQCGAGKETCTNIRTARTAYQVQGWLKEENIAIEPLICKYAVQQISTHFDHGVTVSVWLFSLKGEQLGYACQEAHHAH